MGETEPVGEIVVIKPYLLRLEKTKGGFFRDDLVKQIEEREESSKGFNTSLLRFTRR